MVYSVFNIKGGVAKSTFNIFCATALFHMTYGKNKVCLIEFDNNKSCAEDRQQELQEPEKAVQALSPVFKDYQDRLQNLYPIYSFTHEEYHENLERIKNTFDIVFLDFPGTLESEETAPLPYKSLRSIDKAAIPVLPDKKDRRASMKTMALMRLLDIEAGWFVNRKTNTKAAALLEKLGQETFKKVNEKIVEIKKMNTQKLLTVNSMPKTIENNNSTIIPYIDGEDITKSLVLFFTQKNV